MITEYELVYSTGGHGGPHQGLYEAIAHARRHLDGCPTERAVHIVPRDSRVLDRRAAICTIHRDGVISHED